MSQLRYVDVSFYNELLIQLVKVKEKQARQVFEACSAAQRNDLQVALYLLPYEVVQVLLDGTEQDHLEVETLNDE